MSEQKPHRHAWSQPFDATWCPQHGYACKGRQWSQQRPSTLDAAHDARIEARTVRECRCGELKVQT